MLLCLRARKTATTCRLLLGQEIRTVGKLHFAMTAKFMRRYWEMV